MTNPTTKPSSPQPCVQDVYGEVARRLNAADEPNVTFKFVNRSLFHAHFIARHSGIELNFPSTYLSAAAADWIFTLHSSKPSTTNLRVTQALEALKVEHSAYQPTDDGLMRVHVMIPRPDAPALALMFSGFGDYVLNGDRKYAENGPVAMETEMLQALGWHVVWPQMLPQPPVFSF